MPTVEAEQIVKSILDITYQRHDMGFEREPYGTVMTFAPRIDALVLRKITEMEESWRKALRLERDARAKAEADQRRYYLLRHRAIESFRHKLNQSYEPDTDIFDAGIDSAISAGEGQR